MHNERPAAVSYLAIGDSLTEGIGANSPQQHFVAQLFRYLRHSDHCHFRNWGISGMTSTELLQLVQHSAFQRLLPRLTHLTVTTGGCDFIELFEKGKLTVGGNPEIFPHGAKKCPANPFDPKDPAAKSSVDRLSVGILHSVAGI